MTLATTTFDTAAWLSNPNNVTFSNGNLTATFGSNQGTGRACATRPCLDKTYWEVALTGANNPQVGFCYPGSPNFPATQNYPIGVYETVSLAYDGNNGALTFANNTIATYATFGAGDVVGVAYDPSLLTLWFRVNGGSWNNDGSADPATGVGGFDLNAFFQSNNNGNYGFKSMTPCVAGGNGQSFTAAFDSASWAHPAPSGFVALGSTTPNGHADAPTKAALTSALNTPRIDSVRRPKAGGRVFSPGNPISPLGAGVGLSGTVQENGTPVANRKVFLYDNANGELLGTAQTDGSGNFSLPALARSKVFVVALDPTTYQALVFDRITPA